MYDFLTRHRPDWAPPAGDYEDLYCEDSHMLGNTRYQILEFALKIFVVQGWKTE